ncbi:MAG: ABC transporter permease subunit [Sedimentisphaerales bacterium]|nr:ABC transporter permease subunit [Sedimentisphaerales bacterium]
MIPVIRWPLRFVFGSCLAGPMFDKELRVASRRRRHYVLRSAYVVMLMFFITSIWIDAVRFSGSTAMQQTQMEAAAKTLTRGIVWFQFFAAQIVAVIMMSTAISDEVYSRTLGVLMTTPLSSVQVVLGKLFSRLFQILLLVATTLPLLAVVRVLGGIPWNFLLWSLLITWVSVVFAGSVSLFFSALCRRAYVVIIASAVSIGLLFVLVPLVMAVVFGGGRRGDDVLDLLRFVNPYVLLSYCTDYMLSPFRRARVPTVALIVCTGFLLLGSLLLLHASVRLVRQVALRRATGDMTFLDYLRRRRRRDVDAVDPSAEPRDIQRQIDPPTIREKMICALSRRQKLAAILTIGIALLLLLIAYAFPALMNVVSYERVQSLYHWLFFGFAALLVLSAALLLHALGRVVRQVAPRRVAGKKTFLDRLRRGRVVGRQLGEDRGIRRVVGPPMIWKELTCALSRRQRLAAKLAIGMELLLLLIVYTFPAMMNVVSYEGVHFLYLSLFLGLGVLFTLSASATVIGSERESRAWPLLLLTPLRDRDILFGKFAGVLRRCGLVWLPMLAYVAAFTLADCFRPLAAVQMTALMLSVIVFLTATGFYFGSRCHRTADAVTANLILAAVVWCLIPLVVQWVSGVLWNLRWPDGWAFLGVPFMQLGPILGTTLVGDDGFWRWTYHQKLNAGAVTVFMLVSLTVYALIGVAFLRQATRAFRRRMI